LEADQSDLQTRQRTTKRSFKQIESERREEGLSRPIESTNVGFKLLQKMGFKPPTISTGDGAQSIQGQSEGTTRTPIAVQIKVNRTCLGYEQARQERLDEKRLRSKERREQFEQSRQESEVGAQSQFQNQIKLRFQFKQLRRDLYMAQKACCSLEQQAGLTSPEQDHYWPRAALPSTDNVDRSDQVSEDKSADQGEGGDRNSELLEEDEDQVELIQEQFDTLNDHLRSRFNYCVWCGCRYEHDEELNEQCPGSTREAHDL
jgi:hypothetical protein